MPRNQTTSLNTNVTPEQYAIAKQLAKHDGGIASYLRRLIAENAAKRGIVWPQLVKRGKYKRKK